MIIYDPKITGSFQVNGSTVTSIGEVDTISGSVASLNAATSSYALSSSISGSFTSISQSFASERLKNTTDTLTGDLTVTGTITAQDLLVQEITSSIVYSSGSNIFGNESTNTHTFTGTGSFDIIGIGTTEPRAKLSVYGNGFFGSSDQIKIVGSDNGGIDYFAADGTTFNIRTTAYNNPIIFSQASGERMRISSSGSIGIGTTDPSQKLHVQGGGLFQPGIADGDSIVEIAQTNSNAYVHAGLKINAGGTASPFYIYQSGNSSTLRFNYNSLSDAGGQMVITSDGEVGIGTTNPDRQLEVYGTNDGYLKLDGGRADNHGFTLGSDVYGFIVYDDTSSAYRFVIDQDTGNIGIGTTSPSTKLHLGGTAPLDSIIRQDSTVSGTNWEIGERAAGKWQIWEDDGDSVVATFMSTGNVGIGTETPPNMLTIKGSSGSSRGLDIYHSNGNKVAQLIHNGSGDEGMLNLYDSNVETVRIAGENNIDSFINSGDLGIGTDSPSSGAKLDVNGSLAISNSGQLNLTRTLSTNNLWYGMRYDNSEVQIYTYDSSTRSITFNTVYGGTSIVSQLMKIQQDGNVGIGTTSPAEKFHVNKAATSNVVGGYFTNSQANTGAESVSLAFGLNRSGGDFVRQVKAITFGAEQQWTGTPSTVDGYLSLSTVQDENTKERMRISSGGIVYIMGATASVNNSLQFQYNSTAGSAEIYSKSTAGNTHFEFYASDSGTTNEVMRITKEGRITSATDNKALTAIHPRSIAISHGGSTSWTYDLDPIALFGTRVSGGHLHIRASGWQTRLNAGYIVYRNDGGGSSVIGTGNVTYFPTAHSDNGGSDAAIAVSLPSSSTNVIRISFSGWHSNNHGFECVVTTTN